MSGNQESRTERMARYKEERRKQLAVKYGTHHNDTDVSTKKLKDGTSSNFAPRPTRTSMLRASSQENTSTNSNGSRILERRPCPSNDLSSDSPRNTTENRRIERDKSAKRKSFLNRSLNSEQVYSDLSENTGQTRRRPKANVLKNSTVGEQNRKSELSFHMENARRGVTSSPKESAEVSALEDENKRKRKECIKRMEKLSAKTKQTLANVEMLTSKARESPRKEVSSMKKSSEKVATQLSGPVSILKRKSLVKDCNSQGNTSNHTPPVTFSPNVVEPTTTNRRQGILVKRRSLDESQVMRHRSCSPDRGSILRKQRRSSLEELPRCESPDNPLQGILKRNTLKNEEGDHSLNSPQSILKRKSGCSSANSTTSTPHVSITTAVILAAARGAQMVLDSENESVKPILKKKSLSEDHSNSDDTALKPILKKKSSTDTDDNEDKHKPILKSSRLSLDLESMDAEQDTESDVKPILKHTLKDDPAGSSLNNTSKRSTRRFHTICTDFGVSPGKIEIKKEPDRFLKKPRPISVFELVMNFEKSCSSTGTIPKKSNLKRNCERYRTQPVTLDELKDSLNQTKDLRMSSSSRSFEDSNNTSERASGSYLKSTSSLDNDINFKDSSATPTNESTGNGVKMSSDFEFLSLSDGLKLEIMERKCAESRLNHHKPESQTRCSSKNVDLDKDKTMDTSNALSTHSSHQLHHKEEAKTCDISDSEKTFLRTEIVDERISYSDSESESSSMSRLLKRDSKLLNRPNKGGDSTSDGDSSGSKEVRSIFKSDNKLQIKNQSENLISKSSGRGLLGFRDDSVISENRTSAKRTSTLRRSQTQTAAAMPKSIADLRAKLQEHGESEWRKRIALNNNATDELKLLKAKNRYNDELSEKSLLASKRDELDAAAKQWKERVEKSDAQQFSVAGRMENCKDIPLINIEKTNRTPRARRFKGVDTDAPTTPVSLDTNGNFGLTHSKSVPEPQKDFPSSGSNILHISRVVSVSRPDDDSFTTFFKSVEEYKSENEQIQVSTDDFDAVPRQSLLVIKKNVRLQKRQGGSSRNPIKALAARTDISSEYTEIITGVAEREKKRLLLEKIATNSNSDKAIEALAGLASNEDFKLIALKKPQRSSNLVPYKDLMLIQIKGRRQVQARLVEPIFSSINEGDCFILVTPSVLYHYVGIYSNIIEQSRSFDFANHIRQTGDMGCTAGDIISVSKKDGQENHLKSFWKFLKMDSIPETVNAGHPDEDETYESNIQLTNMVYTFDNDELVPLEEYWGAIPKIEILNEAKIYVFDFGSEMYVWSGKTALLEDKKSATNCAKILWSKGYNYSDCAICPLNVASILGDRPKEELSLKNEKRPKWALLAKLTQHRETILFKEKFLDWPDLSKIIKVKNDDNFKQISSSYDIKPCDIDSMLVKIKSPPDLIIQDWHLGRGETYYDENSMRLFEFCTIELKAWRISETSYEEIDDIGNFFNGDSYIYRWKYRMTVKGRELSGKPSKHTQIGKEKTVFFCWQGSFSSVSEKCTAAFLTIELDKENAPQIRIVEGNEPPAFLGLFEGSMIIHHGKRDTKNNNFKAKMFIVKGEIEREVHLIEVPLSFTQLRSRTSFIIINTEEEEEEEVIIWHGSKSSPQKRTSAYKSIKNHPKKLNVLEIDEGNETERLLNLLGNDKKSYFSLKNRKEDFDFTLRLFHMTHIANEILCPYRSEHSTPYPFLQSELYSAPQPALFLIDNNHELWLWQGWFPENNVEDDLIDQTGSGVARWQAERKASMQTAVNYWKKKHGDVDREIPAYLVWAGLEPLEFQNLFPTWSVREDVAEINRKEGKVEEKLLLEKELSMLTRTSYSITELLQRPLPEGVDPTQLEVYLCEEDFQNLLLISKEEFQKLPPWKQTSLKKEKGLF